MPKQDRCNYLRKCLCTKINVLNKNYYKIRKDSKNKHFTNPIAWKQEQQQKQCFQNQPSLSHKLINYFFLEHQKGFIKS
jgi:hypothetical protein